MDANSGRVAVVTGAGSGLGAALCRLFAGTGMAVAALDINGEAAATTAAEVAEQFGGSTTSARVDVGDASSVADGAEHVRATLGGCDVLCSNVGVQQFGAIDTLTEEDWAWLLNVNVQGTVRVVREFLPMIRERSGPRSIVLTASSSVLAPSVRLGAYQASKYAVMGFGETLRLELDGEGIGVTVLFPGGMLTRHLETSMAARPTELGPSELRKEDMDAMLDHAPMVDGDLVTADEAIRNLLTDLAADEPFSLTHGSYRPAWNARRDAIESAFDRMETT